ncbi:MAG: hypothetical protein OXI87_08670 [Albidovulum sp.]|nr:hypothetical protein [Albidovulum sp.]MDE0530615.1 hypothetical protein [Albidovulum sp.]
MKKIFDRPAGAVMLHKAVAAAVILKLVVLALFLLRQRRRWE